MFSDSRVEDIKRIVYYDYARGAEMYQESSDFGENEPAPTNGWQLENLPADHVEYEGRIPLNMDEIVGRMDCPNDTAFVLEEHRNMIFYDGPTFLVPYFRYKFYAKPYTKGYGWRNRTVAYCNKNSFRWEPLSLNTKIARHIITHEFGGDKKQEIRVMALASLPRLVQREQDRKSRDPNYVERLTMEDMQGLLATRPQFASEFRQHPIIKMIFLHSKLVSMYAFYPLNTLLHLEIDSIHALSEYFRKDSVQYNPADLCFWYTTRQFCASKKETHWFLPQLTQKQYTKLCKIRNFQQKPQTEMAIEIYDLLRSQCNSYGHKYVRRRDLYVLAGMPCVKTFNCAIDDLLIYVYKACCVEKNPDAKEAPATNTLAKGVPDDLVYLREIYVAEEMIVESLQKVCENHQQMGICYKPESEWKKYLFLPSYPMCSEQLRMLEWCMRLWIVNISGPGGSGKTDSLCRYLARVPEQNLLFVTHQANNAATARERVTKKAYTAHKLLHTHCRVCDKTPCTEANFRRRRNGRRNDAYSTHSAKQSEQCEEATNESGELKRVIGIWFNKCIFEEVRVLVIDEISLFYDHLFAGLVYALVHCGKLCQIIICGDFSQQTQIQPGQLQKDLAKAFAEYTLAFEHCHRHEKGSASILWNNAKAIRDMRPDDVYHDGETSLRIPFPKGLQFRDQDMLNFLRTTFKTYGIDDDEHSIVVARTRKLRDQANKIIQELCHNSDSPGLVVGQKIMYLSTNYDLGLTAKEILVLERIEDCQLPRNSSVRTLKCKQYKLLSVLRNDARDTYRHRKPRNMARRLVCRVAGKDANAENMRIIPYNDLHRSLIRKASAITERGIQGSEMRIVCVLKPFFWIIADVNPACYVASSRPKSQILWVCDESTMRQWILNPNPVRRSVMGTKIRKMYEKYRARYPSVADTPEIKALQEEEGDCYNPKFDKEEFERSRKRKRVEANGAQNKRVKI